MQQVIQIRRTSTANNPPTGLMPGELSVEVGTPTRLWVGVSAVESANQRKLLIDTSFTGIAAVSDAPPADPQHGTLWVESDTLILWFWYVDVDSSQWVQLNGSAAGGPAFANVSDVPPDSPPQGSLWWESDTGIFWIYVVDADSGQWVQASGSSGGTGVTVESYTKAEADAKYSVLLQQVTLLQKQIEVLTTKLVGDV